jgi:glycosyltransferase involved in cell wall biosynthesis
VRILIATRNRAVIGGVETHLRAVLPLLLAAGHEIGFLFEEPTLPGAEEIPVGEGPAWAAGDSDVLARVADWRPDVVYDHGLANPDLDSALSKRFPVVFFAHAYVGTCISGNKCHAFPGVVPCHRPLSPACLALYFPRRCGGRDPRTMWTNYRSQRRRQANLASYRAVVVVSRHMADEYRRNGVPHDRVHVVTYFPPIPINPALRDPGPPAPRPRTDRVLYAGRLTRLKGVNHLIEAVPRAAAAVDRNLRLIVAGDGPERERLEWLAKRRGTPAEFRGWLKSTEILAEMRAADLVAVPSLWPEPFGLVGIEAGGLGVPAAGYAIGGINDWLIPGVSGESAPGDSPDPRDLAAALARALGDEAHFQRLRLGAWETARRFDPAAHLREVEVVLRAAAGGGDGV